MCHIGQETGNGTHRCVCNFICKPFAVSVYHVSTLTFVLINSQRSRVRGHLKLYLGYLPESDAEAATAASAQAAVNTSLSDAEDDLTHYDEVRLQSPLCRN